MSTKTQEWNQTRYRDGGFTSGNTNDFPGFDEDGGMNGASWDEIQMIRREMRDLENQRDNLRQDFAVIRNLLIVWLVVLVAALAFLVATS